MLNSLQLTGRTQTHICEFNLPCVSPSRMFLAQSEAGEAFKALCEAASKEGICIDTVSVFREFGAQLQIWNRKFKGERPLYDAKGEKLDYNTLSPFQLVDHILAWSALPGASRHHWGTDFDVIDRSAIPEGYELKLLPSEYASDGIFAHLTAWLTDNAKSYGFFWPYDKVRGGLNPEAWHLSYAPISDHLLPLMNAALMQEAVLNPMTDVAFLGKELVLAKLEEIYTQQVCLVASAPQEALDANKFRSL